MTYRHPLAPHSSTAPPSRPSALSRSSPGLEWIGWTRYRSVVGDVCTFSESSRALSKLTARAFPVYYSGLRPSLRWTPPCTILVGIVDHVGTMQDRCACRVTWFRISRPSQGSRRFLRQGKASRASGGRLLLPVSVQPSLLYPAQSALANVTNPAYLIIMTSHSLTN